LSYYMDRQLEEAGPTPANVARAVGEVALMVGKVYDPIEQSMFAERLARKSGVPLSKVAPRIRRPERRQESESRDSNGAAEFDASLYPREELELVRIALHHPEKASVIVESGVLEKLRSEELSRLTNAIVSQQISAGKIDPAALIEKILVPGLQNWISRVIFEDDPYGDKVDKALLDAVGRVSLGEIEAKLATVRRELASAQERGDEGGCLALVTQQQSLVTELKRMSSNGGA